MKNQRRRKTQSLWLDALRISKSSKISRRSVRKIRESNTSGVPSNTQDNVLSQNADDTSTPLILEKGNANDDICASAVRKPEGGTEASNFPDLEDTTELCHTEQQRSLLTHTSSHDDDRESELEPEFQAFDQDEGVVRLDPIPTNDQHYMPDSETVPESPGVQTLKSGLPHNLQIWKCKLNLTAIVAVVGSVRYTVQQYEYARDMLQDAGAEPTWPPYAKTQRYFQRIIDTCMPNSKLVKLPRSTGVTHTTRRNEGASSESDEESPELENTARTNTAPSVSLRTERVRIFLPSSWAKLDVATSVVFNEMFPSYNSNGKYTPSELEGSAIIRDRASVASSCDHMFANWRNCQVRCGHGSDVEVSVQTNIPSFDTSFLISGRDDGYILRASVVATWCVGCQRSNNPSVDRALNILSLSFQQRAIISALSTGSAPHTHTDADAKGPLPGDLCTLLSSGHVDEHADKYAVVVHRYWRCDDGIPSVILLWLYSGTSNSESIAEEACRVEVMETHVVGDVTLMRSPDSNHTGPNEGNYRQGRSRSHGTLRDGTPFLIYRMLLYCDDFQKSSAMYPKGSAGGCYFLPLSLPPERRRNNSSVRIISLTPPGVSTNKVLYYIVEDIVNASLHGVDGRTPSGQKVKIFIDVVGFVSDYPASASVVDVVGHVCRAPCTLCSFRRLQEAGTKGSRFGYTTKVHASNSAFIRHGERHNSLRECEISDEDANRLGMVGKEKYSDSTCPLLYLQRVLQSQKSKSALANDGFPVISTDFDAFRCNLIAPDHLLTGLGKDILNATFRTLPSKELRLQLDTYICAALRDNGLLRQRQVFNIKKKRLHSMTLSELFCVLVVSVPTMRVIIRQCTSGQVIHQCFELLQRLQRLIALTYWWPVEELDGENAVTLVHSDKDSYFSDLKALSKQYVRSVDETCRKSEEIKGQLDKPNLHRLIELYEHTVPAFGHVREVMELVFESAHQPLKRCISRSNHHDAHVFAVEHCVGNDWQGRIAAVLRNISHENKETRTDARRGLRRLLLGEQADLLDEVKDSDPIATIDLELRSLFTPALRKQFEKDNRISNFGVSKKSVWKARVKIEVKELCTSLNISEVEARRTIDISKRWIKALYPAAQENRDGPLDQGDSVIRLFRKARRVKVADNGRQIGKPSGHDTISANSCVQVYLDQSRVRNKVLTSTPRLKESRPFFFAIHAVLQRKEEMPFALCFKCMKRQEIIRRDASIDNESFQLLRLTPDIRRIALYHICDRDAEEIRACKWEPGTGDVTHTMSLLNGGRFYFQTRVHGYPPRIA